jgi:DNA oxidative demethylase
MTLDLFSVQQSPIELCPGTFLLRGFAQAFEREILDALPVVEARAPFRHMLTPGGLRMSVAMTNCGARGWVSDRKGYRYDPADPETGTPWPSMPEAWRQLSREAAVTAGFPGFEPDACLINRYEPGAKLSLHQDKDERDYTAPVVSVSLGILATFLFGGPKPCACRSRTATWWYGAARRGCSITAWLRSRKTTILYLETAAST